MKTVTVIVAGIEYRIPLEQEGEQAWPATPEAPTSSVHYGRRKGDIRQEPRDHGGG